jgi:hypothetical protein
MKTLSKIAIGAFAVFVVAGCGANPAELRVKIEKVLDGPVAQTILCYQKELLKDRNLKGVVEAKFTVVRGTKAIKDVSVAASTLGNPVVEQCLVEQIARLTFPFDPKVNVTVIWPFEFSPIN